jgi:hypothetical protein
MPSVTIFEQPNFAGNSQVLAKGRYDDALHQITIGNDALSSLKVPQGMVARLFEHFHFQGRFIDIRADTPSLDAYWDNRPSSIVVYDATGTPPDTKEVMIFEHANYAGKSQVLAKGQHDAAQLQIGDNALSSALVPYGMVLRLFENPGFGGASVELREDTSAVSMDWNDRASSVVVEEAPVALSQFSATNAAIMGESTVFNGIRGLGHAGDQAAVVGLNDNKGPGVQGRSDGVGVWGQSATWMGVYGNSQGATGGAGVMGEAIGAGVIGVSQTWMGVYGESRGGGAGVWGEHKAGGHGVVGVGNGDGAGVYGRGGRVAGFFEGDVEVTGDIRLTNADCAEDFDISGAERVAPGTVMVLGDDDTLEPCGRSYDKRVAGVLSGAGNYRPGIVLDKQPSQGNRSPVALLGKVFCQVDAGYGPVAVGDLLTTSDTAGHAMTAADPLRAFGSVIGKALRPLDAGRGLIPILIALQ